MNSAQPTWPWRFLRRVGQETPQGCVEWIGASDREGYGRLDCAEAGDLAHRASFLLTRGYLPDGQHLHHQCGHTWCINPGHLEALTPLEHKRRHQKTHCKHGHPFDAENTYITPRGFRACRVCVAANQRRYIARKKGRIT